MTRKSYLIITLGILAVFINACNITSGEIVTPVPDKLTFLFFFTEG